MTPDRHPPVIGLVGVCASGKTTLANLLRNRGLDCHHIAQEHSYVADMWLRMTHPDVLVFLEVSYANTIQRRNLNWTQEEFQEQLYRLRHAHAHADLVIDTNQKTPEEIVTLVMEFIQLSGIK